MTFDRILQVIHNWIEDADRKAAMRALRARPATRAVEWFCSECKRRFIGRPVIADGKKLCPQCYDVLPERARRAGL